MILGGNDGTHTDIRNNAVRAGFPAFPGKRMIAGWSVLRRQKRFSRLLALIKRWPPQAVSVVCIFRSMGHHFESVAKRRPKSTLSRHPKKPPPAPCARSGATSSKPSGPSIPSNARIATALSAQWRPSPARKPSNSSSVSTASRRDSSTSPHRPMPHSTSILSSRSTRHGPPSVSGSQPTPPIH